MTSSATYLGGLSTHSSLGPSYEQATGRGTQAQAQGLSALRRPGDMSAQDSAYSRYRQTALQPKHSLGTSPSSASYISARATAAAAAHLSDVGTQYLSYASRDAGRSTSVPRPSSYRTTSDPRQPPAAVSHTHSYTHTSTASQRLASQTSLTSGAAGGSYSRGQPGQSASSILDYRSSTAATASATAGSITAQYLAAANAAKANLAQMATRTVGYSPVYGSAAQPASLGRAGSLSGNVTGVSGHVTADRDSSYRAASSGDRDSFRSASMTHGHGTASTRGLGSLGTSPARPGSFTAGSASTAHGHTSTVSAQQARSQAYATGSMQAGTVTTSTGSDLLARRPSIGTAPARTSHYQIPQSALVAAGVAGYAESAQAAAQSQAQRSQTASAVGYTSYDASRYSQGSVEPSRAPDPPAPLSVSIPRSPAHNTQTSQASPSNSISAFLRPNSSYADTDTAASSPVSAIGRSTYGSPRASAAGSPLRPTGSPVVASSVAASRMRSPSQQRSHSHPPVMQQHATQAASTQHHQQHQQATSQHYAPQQYSQEPASHHSNTYTQQQQGGLSRTRSIETGVAQLQLQPHQPHQPQPQQLQQQQHSHAYQTAESEPIQPHTQARTYSNNDAASFDRQASGSLSRLRSLQRAGSQQSVASDAPATPPEPQSPQAAAGGVCVPAIRAAGSPLKGRLRGCQLPSCASGAGCVGLQNLGNTCFMNSILQVLNSVPELVMWAHTNVSMKPKSSVAPAYIDLIKGMWRGSSKGSITPSTFQRSVSQLDSRWGDGSQQDAQEFLHALLEALQRECNLVMGKPVYKELQGKGTEAEQAAEADAYARSWYDSVVDDIFGGLLQSTLQCQVCKRESHRFEPFMDLALPIPDTPRNTNPSVQTCLQTFVDVEYLDGSESYKCEACKCARPHTKRLQIYRPPHALVLTLKRFSQRSSAGFFSRFRSTQKNNAAVHVDVDCLDLTPYCNPTGLQATGLSRPTYSLAAVSHHSGSLAGGHYTASARSAADGHWYHFNDSSVRRESAPSGASSSAYVLLYLLN